MMMIASTSTTIPIRGTFDIALARNTLRTKIASQRWSMSVNAHATITLTALGELTLLTDRLRDVIVTIEMLQDSDRCGIKLSSRFHIPDKRPFNWEEKKRNLEQAASKFDLIETGDEVEITVYIWVE